MHQPIIFIFGPSGVGKSYLLDLMKKQNFLCKRVDTDDPKKTLAKYGFPLEWDGDDGFLKVDFDVLVSGFKKRFEVAKYDGIVVSFPTSYRFMPEKIDSLRQLGVVPVLLWGTEANCKRAAKIRREKNGKRFNERRYDEKNSQTFSLYGRHQYDIFRIETFQKDGNRFSDEEIKNKLPIFPLKTRL